MPVYVHVIDHPALACSVDTGRRSLHPAVADMEPLPAPLHAQAGLDLASIASSSTRTCTSTTAAATTSSPSADVRASPRPRDARTRSFMIGEWVDAPGVRTTGHASSCCCPASARPGASPRSRLADRRRRHGWRSPSSQATLRCSCRAPRAVRRASGWCAPSTPRGCSRTRRAAAPPDQSPLCSKKPHQGAGSVRRMHRCGWWLSDHTRPTGWSFAPCRSSSRDRAGARQARGVRANRPSTRRSGATPATR